MKVAIIAAAAFSLGGVAWAQEEGPFHHNSVSVNFAGWERFDPAVPSADTIASVRRTEPLQICSLERYTDARAGDNANQAWLNERLIERADSLAQTVGRIGTLISVETFTIDGVAVLEAQALGSGHPQPDRARARVFFVRNGDRHSSYRLECRVFGAETAADRAAIDALMNSLHFDRD